MIATVAFISISILTLAMIARNKNNTYVWIFAGLFVSLNIIFISMMFYIIKMSNYYPAFEIENSIVRLMSKMNINFFHIHLMVNIGVVLFIMTKLFFVSECSMRSKPRMRAVFMGIGLVLCLVYLYFNSFSFMQRLHMLKSSGDINSYRAAGIILPLSKGYNIALVALSMFLPYIAILRSYIKTPISFKKKQFGAIFAFLLIVDLFFAVIFVFGSFKGKVINNIEFDNLMAYAPVMVNAAVVYLSMAALIIINVLYVVMAKYRIFDSVNLFKNRVIFKNIKLLPVDMRNINHSYKNSIFAIKIMCDEIKENYIDDISDGIMGQLETLSNLTNSNIKRISEISIQECVDDAVSKLIAKGIKVERNYSHEPKYILAERSQITEAIYNILINSVEAINSTGRTDGLIRVSLYTDADWVCVSVWDNGCGIKKRDIKKLYNPLFTTKKTNKNWGIGLSYSYKVIRAHLGIIFCDSVYGSHTEFQILLPCNHSGKYTIW